MEKKLIWKKAFIFGGAYIGTCVGASFGTGQELLQFFASYGGIGALGAVLAVMFLTIMLFVCIFDARKYKVSSGEGLFIHYGGKYLGRLLYWFTMLLMMCSAAILLSGAGTTLQDYFGIPAAIGRCIIAALVFITILLGLNRMVDVLGRISFLIVLFMVGISIITILFPSDGIASGTAIALADTAVYRPAGNWLLSSFMYFSWSILIMAAYAVSLAVNTGEGIPVQNRGLILGNMGFAACAALPSLAIVSNYSVAGSSQIPNIALGNKIHPIIGILFSIVVIICIYTTICPYIWTVCQSFNKDEKSYQYRIVAAICILVGLIGSSLGTFGQIVSFVSGMSARVGYVFLATIVITKLFRGRSNSFG